MSYLVLNFSFVSTTSSFLSTHSALGSSGADVFAAVGEGRGRSEDVSAAIGESRGCSEGVSAAVGEGRGSSTFTTIFSP
jgi:hypothetical protein